jgi:hypothetical protein
VPCTARTLREEWMTPGVSLGRVVCGVDRLVRHRIDVMNHEISQALAAPQRFRPQDISNEFRTSLMDCRLALVRLLALVRFARTRGPSVEASLEALFEAAASEDAASKALASLMHLRVAARLQAVPDPDPRAVVAQIVGISPTIIPFFPEASGPSSSGGGGDRFATLLRREADGFRLSQELLVESRPERFLALARDACVARANAEGWGPTSEGSVSLSDSAWRSRELVASLGEDGSVSLERPGVWQVRMVVPGLGRKDPWTVTRVSLFPGLEASLQAAWGGRLSPLLRLSSRQTAALCVALSRALVDSVGAYVSASASTKAVRGETAWTWSASLPVERFHDPSALVDRILSGSAGLMLAGAVSQATRDLLWSGRTPGLSAACDSASLTVSLAAELTRETIHDHHSRHRLSATPEALAATTTPAALLRHATRTDIHLPLPRGPSVAVEVWRSLQRLEQLFRPAEPEGMSVFGGGRCKAVLVQASDARGVAPIEALLLGFWPGVLRGGVLVDPVAASSTSAVATIRVTSASPASLHASLSELWREGRSWALVALRKDDVAPTSLGWTVLPECGNESDAASLIPAPQDLLDSVTRRYARQMRRATMALLSSHVSPRSLRLGDAGVEVELDASGVALAVEWETRTGSVRLSLRGPWTHTPAFAPLRARVTVVQASLLTKLRAELSDVADRVSRSLGLEEPSCLDPQSDAGTGWTNTRPSLPGSTSVPWPTPLGTAPALSLVESDVASLQVAPSVAHALSLGAHIATASLHATTETLVSLIVASLPSLRRAARACHIAGRAAVERPIVNLHSLVVPALLQTAQILPSEGFAWTPIRIPPHLATGSAFASDALLGGFAGAAAVPVVGSLGSAGWDVRAAGRRIGMLVLGEGATQRLSLCAFRPVPSSPLEALPAPRPLPTIDIDTTWQRDDRHSGPSDQPPLPSRLRAQVVPWGAEPLESDAALLCLPEPLDAHVREAFLASVRRSSTVGFASSVSDAHCSQFRSRVEAHGRPASLVVARLPIPASLLSLATLGLGMSVPTRVPEALHSVRARATSAAASLGSALAVAVGVARAFASLLCPPGHRVSVLMVPGSDAPSDPLPIAATADWGLALPERPRVAPEIALSRGPPCGVLVGYVAHPEDATRPAHPMAGPMALARVALESDNVASLISSIAPREQPSGSLSLAPGSDAKWIGSPPPSWSVRWEAATDRAHRGNLSPVFVADHWSAECLSSADLRSLVAVVSDTASLAMGSWSLETADANAIVGARTSIPTSLVVSTDTLPGRPRASEWPTPGFAEWRSSTDSVVDADLHSASLEWSASLWEDVTRAALLVAVSDALALTMPRSMAQRDAASLTVQWGDATATVITVSHEGATVYRGDRSVSLHGPTITPEVVACVAQHLSLDETAGAVEVTHLGIMCGKTLFPRWTTIPSPLAGVPV